MQNSPASKEVPAHAPRTRSVEGTMMVMPEQTGLVGKFQRWNAQQRQELRRQLEAGQLTEITFEAIVYRNQSNANHVRFREGDLPAFAQSFRGQPFLRNHDTHDIGARDGTIIDSQFVGDAFQQQIRLTTARGMRSFLEGVIDRFSIGWYFDDVECSVCGRSWFHCTHWPGCTYHLPSEQTGVQEVTCELIFINPTGKETSAVNTPAIKGTGILDQLTQLKQPVSEQMGVNNQPVSEQMGIKQENTITMAQPQEQPSEQSVIYLPNGDTKTIPAHEYRANSNGEPFREAQLSSQKLTPESNANGKHNDNHDLSEVRQLRDELRQERIQQMIAQSGLAPASRKAVEIMADGQPVQRVAQLIEAQREVEAAQAQQHLVKGMRPITEAMMQTPEDSVQEALDWIFGIEGAKVPVPSMRNISDIYQAITGDVNWYGVFNPEWARLATATTTTLAGMVVNALNKVTKMHYDNMVTYRWFEHVVAVTAHSGSTHDVSLITVDGLANLPTVAEGAAYSEATVGDARETMAFTKYGHYVGITLETIRRSDIQRLQAIPRELVKSSVRTRSAKIASIFTQASGTGPTLADDSTVLFHSNHGNVASAAFSAAEWANARTRIWEQNIPGTSKPLGLWPNICLVPIELYDSALVVFGYGAGDVGRDTGSNAQEVNPYAQPRPGDPRPLVIAVPDWTDANDWAYLCDPRLQPTLHMSFANSPQGGGFPMPEIFEVTSETSGLMFSNDTLPVKCRDWWAYGVSTYVGIGKNNVA